MLQQLRELVANLRQLPERADLLEDLYKRQQGEIDQLESRVSEFDCGGKEITNGS